MTQKIKKRIPIKNEFLTKEKLAPVFEDIKDLIISTAKATEAVVRKEIHEVKKDVEHLKKDVEHLKNDVGHVQVAVTEHTKMIKQLQNDVQSVRTDLTGKIENVRTDLTGKIENVRTDLTGKIENVRTDLTGKIENGRIELKGEMHQMENRLTEKIDKQSMRMDDFESRISTIEASR
jgi:chromosome segregation ATPase